MFRRLLEGESACGGGPGMAIMHIFLLFFQAQNLRLPFFYNCISGHNLLISALYVQS